MLKRTFLAVLIIGTMVSVGPASAKSSDLAGSWYSSSPAELKSEINKYLKHARVPKIAGDILGVIAPHAGLRFSGSIAAYSYKAAMQRAPDKVILVGFSHRKYVPNTISVFTDEFFNTPLGKIGIDKVISTEFLLYSDEFKELPDAFIGENSVELQIPFVQTAFPDAKLVILLMCDQNKKTTQVLSNALNEILRTEDSFIMIASSDMSHYLFYEQANKTDAEIIKAIERLDPEYFLGKSIEDNNDERMCGFGAVCSVMSASKMMGADKVELLKYANSGDTSGDKTRVVGYMSAAFVKSNNLRSGSKSESRNPNYETKGDNMFDQEQRDELLKIARNTIEHYLKTGERLDVRVNDDALKQDMGAFVTLHKNGRLRGCIGNMVATGPIYLAVRDMAIAAATEDPRFPKLSFKELDEVDIEVSALSPMEKIDDYNEIEVGKHGVLVTQGGRSGVYLPQVADETGWDRDEFMTSLCGEKAGIPSDAWKTGEAEIYIFTAEVFGEKEEGKK